jgi:RimJ/RimL family protein N-acetyltransferase
VKVLETERLILRRMALSDVDNLLGIFSDPVAMRYYPGTRDRQETIGWIEWTLGNYERDGIGLWVAILKETGEFAGQCGLVVQEVDGRREVEIGYLFLRRCWGRGLATEAARACRNHGFDRLGYDRLISLIRPDNLPSRRVAERVGMTLEQEIERRGMRMCVYAIEKSAARPRDGRDGHDAR